MTTEVMTGLDALNALSDEPTGGAKGPEFTSFKSGSSLRVKVLSTEDFAATYTYGIFKKVNSFAAETPSKKTPKGFPIENLTPWDKAFRHYKDQSESFNDEAGQEANLYKGKLRFAFGFINLDTGEPIIIDFSKKQAQAVHAVIKKNEKKLGKKPFELSKTGESTGTIVALSPEDLEDLTPEQQKHFEEAPESFDRESLQNVFVTKTEAEQVELLKEAGFDVTLIGYDGTPAANNSEDPTENF